MNLLRGLLIQILNMSITASCVAGGVILLRLCLRKSPKIFSYCLWLAVLFRLICPFSFASTFSLMGLFPASLQETTQKLKEDIPANSVEQQSGAPAPAFSSGNPIQAPLPAPLSPRPPIKPDLLFFLSIVWLIGVLLLLLHSLIAYGRLKNRLSTATLVTDRIYETDRIPTAFVFGFLSPKIYLPLGIEPGRLPYILAHERHHIHRRDYLVKVLAYLALCLHWFNPLLWISFELMSRDLEMSCDEYVLKKLGGEIRTDYSASLLSFSAKTAYPSLLSPLAFGENHARARIKNVMNYKRPPFWILLSSLCIVIITAFCLIANPGASEDFSLDHTMAGANTFTTKEKDLIKIGTAAFDHYYSSFKGADIPEKYRLLSYQLMDLSVVAGDDLEFCIGFTYDYTTSGDYFISANGSGVPGQDGGYVWTDCYSEFRIKRLDETNYEIVNVGTGGGAQGLPLNTMDPSGNPKEISGALSPDTDQEKSQDMLSQPVSEETKALIETNLEEIMSSPKDASNPGDYINAHQMAYETILKYSGEEGLYYMLSQFASGNADGLRGWLLMKLCIDLLGNRVDSSLTYSSPQEWYDNLHIRTEVFLPDYTYDGTDPIEKLVYTTELQKYTDSKRGFTVIAPKIFDRVKEDDLLKVIVTTYRATYKLYENSLYQESASLVPAALTFRMDAQGNYTLLETAYALDGADFASSIRDFCTMPVSAKEIPGLADTLLQQYGQNKEIGDLQLENLKKHLKANHLTNITYYSYNGEVIFKQ